jgi:GTPase-associated protein 1, N-terminal domain type 2/GTPase-associated protein 1, middle domain
MTDGFETLIYTDCLPGQGLQGTAGLQFQAQSPGVPPESLNVAKRSLLYEPPANWMRERRPAAEYPPSFAHVWDGFLITAAGVYLGREANGSREGNQLTHCVVTSRPDAYTAPLRPAQLFGAPFWVRSPAPTTTCPPIPPGWEPGPLGVEEVQEFVRAQVNGRTLLPALVSALYNVSSHGPRVLFIAEDVAVVMAWIAAGTLLLPHDQALRIGFKVFSTDPARATQPVVAVHPAWDSTAARVGNDLGYAVFDLTRHECSPLKIVPVAEVWADSFWTSNDPYDVVDAVEVAGESGLAPDDAAVLGRVAVLEDELVETNATVVANWLRTSPATLLANYRGRMVDRLLENVDQWSETILRDLDELVRLGQVPDDRSAAVRVALIRVELKQAAHSGSVNETLLPRLPDGHWLDRHQADAEQALLRYLQTATTPSVFEGLLRVGHRFQLTLHIGQIGPQLDNFLRDWAANPGRPYDIWRWPSGEFIEDQLVEILNHQLPGDRRAAHEVARQWLPRLGHRLDGGDFDGPMHWALLGAVMASGTPQERSLLAETVLAELEQRTSQDPSVGQVVATMWGAARPTKGELQGMAARLPIGTDVPQGLFEELERRIVGGTLTAADLDLARALQARRLLYPSPGLEHRLHHDLYLQQCCEDLRRPQTDAAFAEMASNLRNSDVEVVAVRAEQILLAMLHVVSPQRVARLLEVFPELADHYYQRLSALVKEKRMPEHAVMAFCLTHHGATPGKVAKSFKSSVATWIHVTTEDDIVRATELVNKVGSRISAIWADNLKDEMGKGRAKRLLTRWGLG